MTSAVCLGMIGLALLLIGQVDDIRIMIYLLHTARARSAETIRDAAKMSIDAPNLTGRQRDGLNTIAASDKLIRAYPDVDRAHVVKIRSTLVTQCKCHCLISVGLWFVVSLITITM